MEDDDLGVKFGVNGDDRLNFFGWEVRFGRRERDCEG